VSFFSLPPSYPPLGPSEPRPSLIRSSLHVMDATNTGADSSQVPEPSDTASTAGSNSSAKPSHPSHSKRPATSKHKPLHQHKATSSQSTLAQGEKRHSKRHHSSTSSPGELGPRIAHTDIKSTSTPRNSSSTTGPKAHRSSRDHEGGSDEESHVLVEMEHLHHRTDLEHPEPETQPRESSETRRRGGCCCITVLVEVLKVLSSSWLNLGLILVPFPLILKLFGINQGAVFVLAYLSMFPLSSLLVRSRTMRYPILDLTPPLFIPKSDIRTF